MQREKRKDKRKNSKGKRANEGGERGRKKGQERKCLVITCLSTQVSGWGCTGGGVIKYTITGATIREGAIGTENTNGGRIAPASLFLNKAAITCSLLTQQHIAGTDFFYGPGKARWTQVKGDAMIILFTVTIFLTHPPMA